MTSDRGMSQPWGQFVQTDRVGADEVSGIRVVDECHDDVEYVNEI